MIVTWEKGGEAELVTLEVDKVTLLSTRPSPPGSRLAGALGVPLAEGEAAPELRVKVHACRKEPDGRFRIDGRPLDLTRALLDRIRSM